MLIIGKTGIGKSSLLVQLALCWSVGQAAFGIRSERPLVTLYVQAENDDIDLSEMCSGVMKGMGMNDAQLEEARRNIHVMTEHSRGAELVKRVESEVKLLRADLVILDPAFSYVDGDVSDQLKVTLFLRGLIQPMLERNNIGVIIAHHANKTPTKKVKWETIDYSYLGSGSAEFANWARAVVILQKMKGSEVFELVVSKRGRRAGICDANGAPKCSVHIQHSGMGHIYWEQADPREAERVSAPESAQHLFAVWRKLAIDEAGGVSIADMANEIKRAPKTINRRFENGAVLEFNGETLIRDNGRIYLRKAK